MSIRACRGGGIGGYRGGLVLWIAVDSCGEVMCVEGLGGRGLRVVDSCREV